MKIIECKFCRGTGRDPSPLKSYEKCPVCEGKGDIAIKSFDDYKKCKFCRGTGRDPSPLRCYEICPVCKGIGLAEQTRIKTLSEDDKKLKINKFQIKILFLSANPIDTERLRLDEEMHRIDDNIDRAEYRDKIIIKSYWATRITDIQRILLKHKPQIIHFSGHGSNEGDIVLDDGTGKKKIVSGKAIGNLFKTFKGNVRCVVLNACYSEKYAKAISQYIDCVIGISNSISDDAAIAFASSFYQGIAFGKSIKMSFDLGCSQIELENIGEEKLPRLFSRDDIDPKNLILIKT